MTYDVFISYARGDYADKNKQVIPNNAISRIKALFDEHNITYWFDEEGIHTENFSNFVSWDHSNVFCEVDLSWFQIYKIYCYFINSQ